MPDGGDFDHYPGYRSSRMDRLEDRMGRLEGRVDQHTLDIATMQKHIAELLEILHAVRQMRKFVTFVLPLLTVIGIVVEVWRS